MSFFIQAANATTQVANTQEPSVIASLFPIILIFGIFYLLVIMPQQKKIKKHRETINAIKKGDVVITSGGIYGKVAKINDNILELTIADGVVIQVAKELISNVVDFKFTPVANSSSDKLKKNSKK